MLACTGGDSRCDVKEKGLTHGGDNNQEGKGEREMERIGRLR